MSPLLELAAIVGSALTSGLGVWFWTQHHDHPEYVPRGELELLRSLMTSQHEAILRELTILQDTVTRHLSRR